VTDQEPEAAGPDSVEHGSTSPRSPHEGVREDADGAADVRILVACMGNLLRGDDGFGVAVAEALDERQLPSNVDVSEVGISGVSMAQEMLSGYDAMVLVDAMERGDEPGTLYVEHAEVPDLDQYDTREIGSFAADMHQTDPNKVLVLGEALGVLPEPTILVGCEPQETDDLEDALSEPVEAAVPKAVEHVEIVVDELRSLDGD
jgi:hydrogenase maturation protease